MTVGSSIGFKRRHFLKKFDMLFSKQQCGLYVFWSEIWKELLKYHYHKNLKLLRRMSHASFKNNLRSKRLVIRSHITNKYITCHIFISKYIEILCKYWNGNFRVKPLDSVNKAFQVHQHPQPRLICDFIWS